ncbi:c-type cytochrome [Billgrantia sp. LNSP4103-1]
MHDHGSGNPGGGSSPHEQEEREHTHGEAGASHASHDGGERGSASARAVSDVWTSGENPLPLDDATLARGKQVYQRFCSACHGPTGLGDGQAHAAAIFDPGPANLALHGPSHSAGEYARIVHEGNDASAMPRFAKKLSEEEIWSVVHYIRHGLADDIEDRHDQKHEH